MSWGTGRVLDTVVLSKYCGKCQAKLRALGLNDDQEARSSDEFQTWYEFHKNFCTLNHEGTSKSMETEGASILWKRLVSRLNLRYVNVVSDCDSKAIVQLHKIMPYGSNVSIEKYECVGHVQKRVGAFIINLRKNPPPSDRDG